MDAKQVVQLTPKIRSNATNFRIICSILKNIINHPKEPKFKSIKLSNPKLSQVLKQHECFEFLLHAGFTVEDQKLVFPTDGSIDQLKHCVSILENKENTDQVSVKLINSQTPKETNKTPTLNGSSYKCSRFDCSSKIKKDFVLVSCSKCGCVYCSNECKEKDKDVHSKFCEEKPSKGDEKKDDKSQIVTQLLLKFSLGWNPFVVAKYLKKGKGVLYVEAPLEVEVFQDKYDEKGFDRQLYLQFLTPDEFVKKAKQDEKHGSKLSELIPMVLGAMELYNPKTHVVLAFQFGCGYRVLLQAPLIPKFEMICSQVALKKFDNCEIFLINLDR